jgi:hypothetical protein
MISVEILVYKKIASQILYQVVGRAITEISVHVDEQSYKQIGSEFNEPYYENPFNEQIYNQIIDTLQRKI